MTQSETVLTVFCFLTIYFAVCWPIGFLADQRGRNFLGWTILSMIFSPIIGFVLVLAFGETEDKREARIRKEARIWFEEEQKAKS